MGILINNIKIIYTSTFTIIHTNFNHYLETYADLLYIWGHDLCTRFWLMCTFHFSFIFTFNLAVLYQDVLVCTRKYQNLLKTCFTCAFLFPCLFSDFNFSCPFNDFSMSCSFSDFSMSCSFSDFSIFCPFYDFSISWPFLIFLFLFYPSITKSCTRSTFYILKENSFKLCILAYHHMENVISLWHFEGPFVNEL